MRWWRRSGTPTRAASVSGGLLPGFGWCLLAAAGSHGDRMGGDCTRAHCQTFLPPECHAASCAVNSFGAAGREAHPTLPLAHALPTRLCLAFLLHTCRLARSFRAGAPCVPCMNFTRTTHNMARHACFSALGMSSRHVPVGLPCHAGGVKVVDNNSCKVSEVAINGLFFAIGHRPATEFLEGQVGGLDLAGRCVPAPQLCLCAHLRNRLRLLLLLLQAVALLCRSCATQLLAAWCCISICTHSCTAG